MKDLRDLNDLVGLQADVEAPAHEIIIGSQSAAFRQAQKRPIVVDRNRLQLPANDPGWLRVAVSHLWQDGIGTTRDHEKVMGFFWWRREPSKGDSMAVVIRKAEAGDLEALGRLGAMLIRTHYAFDRHRFLAPNKGAESGYASFLGRVLDSPDACVFVAERDGAIAGYVFAALEPLSWKELRGPAGFIHDVAVAEEARRLGIGTKLIQVAVEWLRERGAPRVILWSAAPNESARALFRRLGFRDTMVEMTMEL